jgi:hypothetical protein
LPASTRLSPNTYTPEYAITPLLAAALTTELAWPAPDDSRCPCSTEEKVHLINIYINRING